MYNNSNSFGRYIGKVSFHAFCSSVDRTFLQGSVCTDEDVAAGLFTADVTSGVLIIRGAAAERSRRLPFPVALRSYSQFVGQPPERLIFSLMINELERLSHSSR